MLCLSCCIQDLWSLFWRAESLLVACELLVAAGRALFPHQGLNPGPLHWKCGVFSHCTTREVLLLILIFGRSQVFLCILISNRVVESRKKNANGIGNLSSVQFSRSAYWNLNDRLFLKRTMGENECLYDKEFRRNNSLSHSFMKCAMKWWSLL